MCAHIWANIDHGRSRDHFAPAIAIIGLGGVLRTLLLQSSLLSNCHFFVVFFGTCISVLFSVLFSLLSYFTMFVPVQFGRDLYRKAQIPACLVCVLETF